MNAAAFALEFPEPSKNWVTQRYTLFCSLLQHLCGAIDANLGTCTPACKRQRRLADKEMIDPELALISRLFIFLVYVSLFSIRQNSGEKESRSPFILASSLDNITIFHTHNLSRSPHAGALLSFLFFDWPTRVMQSGYLFWEWLGRIWLRTRNCICRQWYRSLNLAHCPPRDIMLSCRKWNDKSSQPGHFFVLYASDDLSCAGETRSVM